MSFKIQGGDKDYNVQLPKESKVEVQAKIRTKGSTEVSRPGMVAKSKAAAGAVVKGLKRFLGKESKATNTNIAKTVDQSLNIRKPVVVVSQSRMAEAGVKMEMGLKELKATETNLKALEATGKGLSQSLQDSIENGRPTGEIRIAIAENQYKMAELQEKVNAGRHEVAKEARVLFKSASMMESTQAAEVLSEHSLPQLEGEREGLKLNTEIAKLKLEIAKAELGEEKVSDGTKELLKAQLGVAQAKGTEDEGIIMHAELRLNNLSVVSKLEAELDKVASGAKRMPQGEKLILRAQLALAKAEATENKDEIKQAKNEVESFRLVDETARTEHTYLTGLHNLDAIVEHVLENMPELQSFSVDLKRHIQMAEEFGSEINQVMNQEGLKASDMAVQIFEQGLVQRLGESFIPLNVKFEENSKLLSKIDLATMCPPSLVEARNKGSLGSMNSLQITQVQRMLRYRMLLDGIVKNSPANEALSGALQTVEQASLKINEEKRIAEQK